MGNTPVGTKNRSTMSEDLPKVLAMILTVTRLRKFRIHVIKQIEQTLHDFTVIGIDCIYEFTTLSHIHQNDGMNNIYTKFVKDAPIAIDKLQSAYGLDTSTRKSLTESRDRIARMSQYMFRFDEFMSCYPFKDRWILSKDASDILCGQKLNGLHAVVQEVYDTLKNIGTNKIKDGDVRIAIIVLLMRDVLKMDAIPHNFDHVKDSTEFITHLNKVFWKNIDGAIIRDYSVTLTNMTKNNVSLLLQSLREYVNKRMPANPTVHTNVQFVDQFVIDYTESLSLWSTKSVNFT